MGGTSSTASHRTRQTKKPSCHPVWLVVRWQSAAARPEAGPKTRAEPGGRSCSSSSSESHPNCSEAKEAQIYTARNCPLGQPYWLDAPRSLFRRARRLLDCGISTRPMTAWGQKRPNGDVRVESAVPRTADIGGRGWQVSCGPRPDSCSAAKNALLDHLVALADVFFFLKGID